MLKPKPLHEPVHMIEQQTDLNAPTLQQSNANAALDRYFMQLTDSDNIVKSVAVSASVEPEQTHIADAEEKKRVAQQLLQLASNSVLEEEACPVELAEPLANASELQNIAHNHKEIERDADTIDIEETRDHRVSLQTSLSERFQVLLCKVAGLTIAVPLVELGGIHQLTKLSTIAGKPDWFKGILIKGDVKYQCIDAARWIMPEKVSAEMAKTIDYKFAIQLGKSPYVLCCESVSSTVELSKDEIKWRKDDIKRPWLAGLLKEKMCALIDGARMVQVVLHEVR